MHLYMCVYVYIYLKEYLLCCQKKKSCPCKVKKELFSPRRSVHGRIIYS